MTVVAKLNFTLPTNCFNVFHLKQIAFNSIEVILFNSFEIFPKNSVEIRLKNSVEKKNCSEEYCEYSVNILKNGPFSQKSSTHVWDY